jgi:hypothetical protein
MFMRWWRRLLMALLAVTALALVWNHWGMERRLVIDAASRWPVMAVDDRSADDGNSVSKLRREGQRLVLDCVIGKRYQYPFLRAAVRAGAGAAGHGLVALRQPSSLADGPGGRQGHPGAAVDAQLQPALQPRGGHRLAEGARDRLHPAQYPGGLEFPLAASRWLRGGSTSTRCRWSNRATS